ncbi:MAG: cytochrome C, partial [Rhodospirillales bacterium]|nr:cytochrome C [Rhodospirillales bacterium]
KHGIDVPGAMVGGRASCESCHGFTPHPEDNHPKLNDHTDRVACQTCHIPRYSRGDFATKSWWDWSTAGQLNGDGTVLSKLDENGLEIYNSKKGDFKWDEWSRPEFRWFNGTVRFTLYGDEIDPERTVEINSIEGDSTDPDARIWPFKIMRGRQPYDTENKSIVAVLTTGETGYWKTFDWPSAIEQGMERIDHPYSGEYDFVTTEMYWPISHMVAPAREALACNDCHSKDGLLENLTGFYMPGRDSYAWLTQLGWAGTLLALIGVFIHLCLRVVLRGRNSK